MPIDELTPFNAGQQVAAESLSVTIASDQPSVPVSVGAPAGPATHYLIGTATKSGSADLTTPDLDAKRLRSLQIWGSMPYKAQVFAVANGTEGVSPIVVGGADQFGVFDFEAPDPSFFTLASSAGVDAFRIRVLNLGNKTASFEATLHVED